VWKAQERKAAEEIKMMVVVVAITKLLWASRHLYFSLVCVQRISFLDLPLLASATMFLVP